MKASALAIALLALTGAAAGAQTVIPQCNSTGVSASRDGKSLYFIANPGITSPTLLQITLPSMHAVSQAIYNPVVGYRGIEDIDVLPLQ